MSLLSVENMSSGYGKGDVLSGVSFDVKEGEIVALIGPNGAGKSTALKTVFGFLNISKGKISFEGKSITREKPHEMIKLGMSFVHQGRQVFRNMTVEENLELGAFTDGKAKKNIVKQFRELDDKLPIFGQFEIEDPAFLVPVGESAEGVTYVYPKIDAFLPETAEFIEDYHARYDSYPNYYAFVGYDSLKLLDAATTKCGAEGTDCIISEMLSAEDFPGVSGRITFNPDKTLSREFVIKTVRNGNPTVIQDKEKDRR